MKMGVKTASGNYDIFIEQGIFANCRQNLDQIIEGGKLFVVTDATVNAIYREALDHLLCGLNFSVTVLEPGERTKSMESLQKLYSRMAQAGISRTDTVLAFGGGVIGDLTGFAAATFLRGVKFINIPTTLLAQVDSSVGGKVAVDLPEGKNLVGSFYPPQLVIVDPDFLDTLPERVFDDGMAEVIKYGVIRDAALFSLLETDICDKMEEIIYTCLDIKRSVVEADEFDTGERMILNFGHTFGHIVEKLGDYSQYTHGEGVAIGMQRITEKGEAMGITKPGTYQKIYDLCKKYNLVFDDYTFDKTKAEQVLFLDKKSTTDTIRYVIPEEIGKVVVKAIPKENKFLLEDGWTL